MEGLTAAALHNRLLKKPRRLCGSHQGAGVLRTRALPAYRHALRIAAKRRDVLAYPMQREDLVAQAVVAGTGIGLSEFGGKVKKTQRTHAICGSHTDNSVARKVRPVRDTAGRAGGVAAAIDPDQYRMRPRSDRHPHVQ